MRSVIYILCIVLAGILFLPASAQKSDQEVIIQVTDENPDPAAVADALVIMTERLKDIGITSIEVRLNEREKTLGFVMDSGLNMAHARDLLRQKGKLEIYPCYLISEVLPMIPEDDSLFLLLDVPDQDQQPDVNPAVLGSCSAASLSRIDAYLNHQYAGNKEKGIRFLWSASPAEDGQYRLYILHYLPAIDGSFIAETEISDGSGSDRPGLMIRFNEEGALKWAELTKDNLGRPVSIVIDDLVYMAPLVRAEIRSGKCLITGDFSLQEIRYLNALISHGELPVNVKVKE